MEFIKVEKIDVPELSVMATEIVREHFDPIIGAAQNDYMLELFQTEEAILEQLDRGYQYYYVCEGEKAGFLAFYPKGEAMYLSKFYLYKEHRGKGYARKMLDFVIKNAVEQGLKSVELNVNKENEIAIGAYEKMGFAIIRKEKNDIGNGFFMDDYVYGLMI